MVVEGAFAQHFDVQFAAVAHVVLEAGAEVGTEMVVVAHEETTYSEFFLEDDFHEFAGGEH